MPFFASSEATCNLRVELGREGRIWTKKSAGCFTQTSITCLLLRCDIAEKISCFLGGVRRKPGQIDKAWIADRPGANRHINCHICSV